MQFGIWWIAVAIVIGFVFGFAVAFLADKAMMARWRKDVMFAQFCVTALVGSCRDVLSDSWYKKVMRTYKAKVEAAR